MTKPDYTQFCKITVLLMVVFVVLVKISAANGIALALNNTLSLSKISDNFFFNHNISSITCPEDITTYTDLNLCTALISSGLNITDPNQEINSLTWVMSGATNNASPSTGINQINSYVFNEGTTVITYQGNDRYNNSIDCTFAVTVVDNQAPSFEKPLLNITIAADYGDCGAEVEWPEPKVADNCAASKLTSVNCSHNSGTWFQIGNTKVVYQLNDGIENNNVEYTFIVAVVDNEIPKFVSPDKVSINCGDPVPEAYVSVKQFIGAGGIISDNCKVNTESFAFVGETRTGTVCPFSITRTYRVEDENGNIAEVDHNILVVDEDLMLKSAAANISAAQTGNWSDAATWTGGVVPTSGDNVTIPSGITVTVDITTAVCNNVSIASGGSLIISGSNILEVYGNWTNNGSFNAGTNGTIEFTGTNNATISGTNSFEKLIISKGSISTSLIINGNTVVAAGGSFSLNSGLITIGSGSSLSLNQNSALTIPASAGFDVTGGTLITGNFSITNNGLIRISSGIANFGTNSGNTVHTQVDGAFIVNNGTVNVAGRLENTAGGTLAGAGVNSGITIAGGTVTLATEGNGLSNVGSLNVSANGDFSFTGGTIVFENPSTAATELDLGIVGGAGTKDILGGTFQFGNASTPSSSTFNLSSEIPLGNISSSSNADLVLKENLEFTGTLSLHSNTYIELQGHTLQQNISARGTFTFPIADDSGNPVPVIINITSGAVGPGDHIEITTTSGKHPNSNSNTDYLNQYWTINLVGISSPVYTISATYQNSDIQGTESEIAAGVWNGSSWNKYNVANAGTNTISATGVNVPTVSFTGITLAPPTVSITNGASISICNGTSVAITTTINGDAPLSYSWNPTTGLSNPNIANPTASPSATTSYTLTVTDGNGFTGSDNINIIVNSLPTATVSGTNTVCQNNPQPQITFTGASGAAPYTFTYRINSGANQTIVSSGSTATLNVSTTSSGIFNYNLVSVQDNNGCSQNQSGSASVTVNSLPTASVSGTTTVCQNDTRPEVTFTGANGAAPYTFTYRINGGGIQTIVSSGNTAVIDAPTNSVGTFNYNLISVEDNNSCTQPQAGSAVIEVEQHHSLALSSAVGTDNQTICINNAINSITYSVGGGANNATISSGSLPTGVNSNYSGGTFTISGTPTQAGTFNYTITTSGNSCNVATASGTIEVLEDLTASVISSAQTICYNTSPSVLSATVATGGKGPIIYQWQSSPNGSSSWTNIAGQTSRNYSPPALTSTRYYRIVATDNGSPSCGSVTSNTIAINVASLLESTINIPAIACKDGSTSIQITATGGTAPYSYSFNGSTNSTGSFTAYAGTAYSYFVTDANGCTYNSAAFDISEPNELTATATPTHVDCNGGTNGSIDLVVSGGTTNYSYLWDNGAGTSEDPSNLAAGNYTVTVTDANSCIATASSTITEPTALTALVSETNSIKCFGETADIKITAAGGTGTKTYTFNGDSNGTGIFTGITAQNGITWSVTDDNNCAVSGTYDVAQPPVLVIDAINSNSAICEGETLNLTSSASGGTGTLHYNWTGPNGFTANNTQNPSIVNAPAINNQAFDLTVTDDNSCSASASTDVTVYTTPDVSANLIDDVICSDDNVDINLSSTVSGTTFNWTVVETNITGASAGSGNSIYQTLTNGTTELGYAIYTITPSSNGCDGPTQEVTVTVNPVPNVEVTNSAPIICNSGSTSILLNSDVEGVVFDWTARRTGGSTTGFSAGTGSEIVQALSGTGFVEYEITPRIPGADNCTGPAVTVVVEVISTTFDWGINTSGPNATQFCNGDIFSLDFSTSPNGTGEGGDQWYSTYHYQMETRFDWNVSNSEITSPTSGVMNSPGILTFTSANTTDSDQEAVVSISSVIYIRSRTRARYWHNWGSWSSWDVLCAGGSYTTNITVYPYELKCPNNSNVNVDPGQCTAALSPSTLEFSCYPTLTYSMSDGGSGTGDITNYAFSTGTTTVTYRAEDTPALFETCSFDVTVTDNINPTITCPADIIENNDPGVCGALVSYTVTTDDNCPGEVLSLSSGIGNGNLFPIGTTTETYVVTDASGNSATCSFDVTVNDTEVPTVNNCPSPASVCAPAGGSYVHPNADWDATFDDNCGVDVINYALSVGGLSTGSGTSLQNVTFPVGTTLVEWTATDNAGNTSAICSYNVVVNEEPTAVINPASPSVCLNHDITLNATVTGTPNFTYQWRFNGGNISGETGNQLDLINVQSGDAGSYDVVVTSVLCGSSITSAPVSLGVSSPIVITKEPVDQTDCFGESIVFEVAANGGEGAYTYAWQMRDNASASWVSIGGNQDNLLVSNIGIAVPDQSQYRVTITDGCLNSETSAIATITANQIILPLFSTVALCQGEATTFTVTTSGAAPSSYQWYLDGNPVNNDTHYSGALSQTLTVSNSQAIHNGTYSVKAIFDVTQPNNNGSNTCESSIVDAGEIVVDVTPPTAVCQNITVDLDATGNVSITPEQVDDGSFDNCGTVSLSLDVTDFDCDDVGDNTVTLSVSDNAGNTSTCTSTVTVEDNIDPAAVCKNITVELDASGSASIVAADIDNGSGDNCGTFTLAASTTTFDCSNIGDNTVTLSVTDEHGGVETCDATVTVEDNIVPTALCQDFTVQLNAGGNATIAAADIDNGSSDNCGIASLVLSQTDFTCSDVGSHTITLTVTDDNGNSSSCTASVTVEDNVAPTAICQDITVQLNATGNITIAEDAVDNGSNDACSAVTLDTDVTSFDCTNLGPNTVTLTVTDANGNSSNCTATVTVDDTDNPVAINASVSQDPIICFGDLTTVTISSTGGVGVLTYTFNGDSNNTGIFTNIAAGTNYNWSVTNPLGCGDISGTFDVVEPAILSADVTYTDVTCSNNDATITMSNPQGGSGTYEYSIDGGTTWQTGLTFTGLVPGNYNVQMRDANEPTCILVLNNDVEVYKLTADVNSTNVSCFNAADGTVIISNTHGGSNVYEYTVNGGSSWVSTSTITGLAPGTYDVRIRDANEIICELTLDAALVITQPDILAADVTFTNVTCNGANDGSITISNPSGGYGTYEYTINGGANWQNSENFGTLNPGSYDVRIRDAVQTTCEIVLDGALLISEPPVPDVSNPGNQVLCANESIIDIVFSGSVPATTFNWTNDTPSIGLAASGTGDIASFTATNSTNAAITATITITPEITNEGVTCYGVPVNFTITVNPNPDVIATPVSEIICDGDATNIALSSNFVGTVFNWTVVESGVSGASDGTGIDIIQTLNVTSAAPGTATYTVTPSIGTCNGSPITVVVTVNPLPTANLSGSTTICVGSSADLTVDLTGEQPWSITYTDGITPVTVSNITSSPYTLTLTPAVTTNYQLTAVSDNNCSGTSFTGNVTIDVDQLPEASAGGTQTICLNGTATVTGANAANGDILWTHDGAGSLSDETTTAPTYTPVAGDEGATITLTMTVTGNNSCVVAAPATATYTVNVDPLPTAAAGGSETICFDGTATVTGASATNGTILWTHDGSGTITGDNTLTPSYTATGGDANNTVILTMTVTSDNACSPQSTTATYTVNVYPEPQVDRPADQEICTGSTTTMINFTTTNVTGTTTYSWTNSEPSIGLAASGTGSIIPFTGINSGDQPIVADIVVTPHLTSGGLTCDGPAETFTITVNPVPVAVAPIGLMYCDGLLSDPFPLTGTPTGVVFDITGGASIGLPDLTNVTEIPAFTPVEGTANLTMTPSAFGCNGLPVSFNVTVRPTPTATISGGTTVCQNSAPPTISIGNPMTLTIVVEYSVNSIDNYIVNVPGNSNVTIAVPTNIPGTLTYELESVQYLNSSPPICINTEVTGTAIIEVIAEPLPTISGPTNICAETTVNTYTTEAGMSNYAWIISAGGTITAGGTSNDNTVTVVWTTGGAHNVSIAYSNANNCAAPTPTVFPVNVYALPIPTITGSTSACEGVTNKVYSTRPGMTNYEWVVSAGGTITAGGTTNDNSVTVTWNSVGPQTISVNYLDATGCEALAPTIKNITVNPLPVPGLNGANSICAGETETYDTDPGMSGYIWAVSSGGTIVSGGNSTSNTATILWNTGGSQTVSVSYQNANNCGPASPTIYAVAVDSMPVPALTGSTDVCVGSTSNIYETDAGMTDYDWIISAGGTITAGGGVGDNSVTVTWNTTGAQTVGVNYTNANNCSASSPTLSNVTVHSLPVPNIGGPQNSCVGIATNVYTTVAGMSDYEWTVSAGGTITAGGTLTDNTVTVTWDDEGSQNVSLNFTSLNGCRAASATDYVVDVHALPTPKISGPTDGCTGIAGVEYKTEHSMIGYVWRVTGGSIVAGGSANDSTVTIVWNTPGMQTLEVNYYNPNNCTAENPTVLNVNVIAPSPPTCPDDLVVCSDDAQFEIDDASQLGGAYTGPGVSFNGTKYEFDPGVAGVGTHTINYTMPNLCEDNCSFTITVNPVPIGSAPDITICSGDSVNIILSSTEPGTTYSWTASVTSGSASGFNNCGGTCGDMISDEITNNSVKDPGGANGSNAVVTYVVTATKDNCSSTFEIDVTVRPEIIAFDLTWNSNFVEDFIEICAGAEALSDNDIEILHPGTGNLVTSAGIPTSWSPTFLYGPTADGPWTSAPGYRRWGSGGIYEWVVDLSINNQLGYHYFVMEITDPVTGCVKYSNPAILNVVSTLIVEAGDPEYMCGGSTIALSGAYVGGISSDPITGRWSISNLSPSNGGSNGSLSSSSFRSDPDNVTYTPPSGYVGTVTLTLTTNDPAGTCVAIEDTRTITIAPPTSFDGCLELSGWPLSGSNSNGSRDDNEEPCLVKLVGSNNLSGTAGITDITHCSGAGTVSFDWAFLAPDNKIVWHQEDQNEGSNSGSSNMVVTRPSNVSEGDLIIVTIHIGDNNLSFTRPSGFQVIEVTTDNSDRATVASFYKIATASEPTSYSFGVNGGSVDGYDKIYASRITGHNASNPIGGTSERTQTFPSGGAQGYRSINLTGFSTSVNSMLVAAIAVDISGDNELEFSNAPLGMTTVYYDDMETSTRVATDILTESTTGNRSFQWPSYNTRNRDLIYAAAQMFTINAATNELDEAYYLVDGTQHFLSSTNGESGTVSVDVASGSAIGFRVSTNTNTGGPGELIIYNVTVPNDKPVLTGSDSIFINDCQNDAFLPTFEEPIPVDDCGTPIIQTGYPVTDAVIINGCTRTQNRTWVFVDDCGVESEPFTQTAVWMGLVPLSVGCPTDPVLEPCTADADITTAYNNWLAGFTASGGCDVQTNILSVPPLILANIACGDTLTFTYTATDACGQSESCISTFTVKPVETLEVTCPVDTVLSACSDQATIQAAYDAWVAGFAVNGGCATVSDNIATIPALTDLTCGGQIEFIYEASNTCGQSASCISTFKVAPPTELTISVPAGVSLPICPDSAFIRTEYDNWKAGFTTAGGCNVVTNIDEFPALDGVLCGGSLSFTFTAENGLSACANSLQGTSTFTIAEASALIVNCPADSTIEGCLGIQAITDAYDTWVDGFTTSGGCNVVTNIDEIPPLGGMVCNGQISFTYKVDNGGGSCAEHVECTSTFTIGAAPLLTVTAPADTTARGCSTDQAIIDEFNNWKAGFSHSGGCNVSFSDISVYSIPNSCGGTVTIEYTATDNCGQSVTNSASFTLFPEFLTATYPNDEVQAACQTQAQVDSAFAVWIGKFGVTGGCGAVGTDLSTITAPNACGGTVVVNYTGSDICGQVVNHSAVFTIDAPSNILQEPSFTVPADMTLYKDDVCSYNADPTTITGIPSNLADNCTDAGNLTMSYIDSIATGSCSSEIIIYRRWTVADNCLNETSQVQLITVTDTTPPIIICASDVSASADSDGCDATGLDIGTTNATDNCLLASLVGVRNDGLLLTDTYPVGVTLITWTATDACGNWSTCEQKITVLDNGQPPTITCPANVVQTADPSNCFLNNVAIDDPIYDDNCVVTILTWTFADPDGDVHSSPATGINFVGGETFEVGTSTVTYTAYDEAGQQASCSFNVTILDVFPPEFTNDCPLDITQDSDPGVCEAFVNVPAPAFTDPCNEGVTLTHDSPYSTNTDNADGTYPVGTTQITWILTDDSGNTVFCIQNIIVNDVEFPILTCPTSVTEQLSADNCTKTGVNISGLAYDDNCGVVTLIWEIEDPIGNSTTSDSTGINLVDGEPFQIGTSTVTYTAYDAAGNSTTCFFTVTIERTEIPASAITCPTDPDPVSTSVGDCDAFVTVAAPIITDICLTTTYTIENDYNNTADASDTYPIGITIVSWSITDNLGNTNNSCVQTVLVTDNQPPIITTCPVPLAFEACSTDTISSPPLSTTVAGSNYAEFSNAINQGVAIDNCAIDSVNYIDVTIGTCPIVITRTWTVFDVDGNTDQCDQIITIDDTEDPLVDCPTAGFDTPSDFNLPYATFSIPVFDYSDNCTEKSNIAITWTMTGDTNDSGTGLIPSPYQFSTGVTLVNYVFTDECGNFTECQFTVTAFSPPATECILPDTSCADLGVCYNHIEPADLDNPGVPINLNPETLDWTWTIINPDGSTGATGSSTGVTAQPIGPYDFQLGTSTIQWSATNASGSDECEQLFTVEDCEAPTFLADPFEDCVELLFHALYAGDADNIDYNPDYPNGDYKILYIGDTYLDIDLITYSDNCCVLADSTSIRWIIDFEGNDPSEPSIFGAGQPSEYKHPVTGLAQDIYLWGDGVNFISRVHTITYWMEDCNGVESAPITVNITINPRPKIIKKN